MKEWDKLSMRERAAAIRQHVLNALANGESLTSLNINQIRHLFDEGGPTRRLDLELEAKRQFPMLNNIDFQVFSDPLFNNNVPEYGGIEYMGTSYTPYNDYHNPRGELPAIVYNPSKLDDRYILDAINLDAISHGMHLDATYDVLQTALGKSRPVNARFDAMVNYLLDTDKFANTSEEERMQYLRSLSLEERNDLYKEVQWEVPNFTNEYYDPVIDGQIRAMLVNRLHPNQDDPFYQSVNYNSKAQEEFEKYNPQEVKQYMNDLIDYIQTGRRPSYILPEVTVTPNKALGGKVNVRNWRYM